MIIKNKDLYQFAEEPEDGVSQKINGWKILTIDPEENIHSKVKEQLKDFRFEDKEIVFFNASSYEEAKRILNENGDFAIVITKSNLDTLKYIRDTLKKNDTRIIIFTSQNDASEKQFILDYDIHIELNINQLSDSILFSSLLSALRAYSNLSIIKKGKEIREEIIIAANRFVPQSFLKILKKDSIANIELDNYAEKNLSILFLDIRSFTSLSEFLTPIETFKFINNCMSYLEPHIIRNNGFIDKYIGDSLMALFPNSPDDAVTAAIQMLKSLETYNADRIMRQQIPINIGIGINTGKVVIGTVGFHDRMECTVIGDAVNLASRVEKMNKLFGTNLLINEQTYLNLTDPNQFNHRSLGKYQVYGKKQFYTIHEIFDTNSQDVLTIKKKTLNDFTEAVISFQNNEFIQAQRIFRKILKINKHDAAVSFFLDRIETILKDKDISQ